MIQLEVSVVTVLVSGRCGWREYWPSSKTMQRAASLMVEIFSSSMNLRAVW